MRTVLAALGLLFAACSSAPSLPQAEAIAADFDAPIGAPPPGMQAYDTGPNVRSALWLVQESGADGSAGAVQIRAPGSTGEQFHLLLSEAAVAAADLRIETLVRSGGGKEDQGGGLAFRVQDPNNYYVTRWNPLEDNVRIYHVKDGVRTMLETAKVLAPTDRWHRLAATVQGARLRVWFDGDEVLSVEDTTFAAPGRVGLWTKADASSWFDAFAAEPLAAPR
jgi:hypothetical protein